MGHAVGVLVASAILRQNNNETRSSLAAAACPAVPIVYSTASSNMAHWVYDDFR
jgi:hypothetical protein